MAFYPDVQPGDDLDYSAQRENDLRHLLNSGNGFGDGVNRGKTHKVRVPVWNITPNNINSGSLVYVVVSGNSMCGEAFPVAPVTDYNDFDFDSAPFGILENSLKPKATGDLVLSGTVSVSISGSTEGNFAKPTSDGTFERGQEGFRILHLNGSSAIILVGDYRYNFTPGVGINKAELSGGTISTALVQGSNVTLTPDPDTGAITISATGSTSGGGGGGSGFIPAWSNSGHTDVLPISSSTYGSGYPANADGWIYACAYFDPADDRMRYKHYDAHVVVNGARMKVAELKLPSGSAFIKIEGSSTKYYRDLDDDWSNDPYAEHPYYSYFAWQAGEDGPVIYTASVTPVIGDSTYTYDDVEEEFVETQNNVDDTNSAAYAVGVGSAITIPVRSGATIYFIATADGNAFYSRYATPPCFCVFYSSNPPSAS